MRRELHVRFCEGGEVQSLSATRLVILVRGSREQGPIKDWHPIIGEPTVADAILDRLLHHSFKIELKGESIRKTKK